MFTKFRSWVLLLAFFALGACTEYAYIPPPGPEGRACVSQCQFDQQQCRAFADRDYQHCNASRNFAMAAYNRCVQSRGMGCVQPPACLNQSWRCSGDFDRCFRGCGGRIEEVEPRR